MASKKKKKKKKVKNMIQQIIDQPLPYASVKLLSLMHRLSCNHRNIQLSVTLEPGHSISYKTAYAPWEDSDFVNFGAACASL